MVDKTIHMLVIGADEGLQAEFESAMRSIRSPSVLAQYATDIRKGMMMLRDRRPEVVCIELTRDIGPLKTFAADLKHLGDEPILIGVYRQELFRPDEHDAPYLIDAMRCSVRDLSTMRPYSSSACCGTMFTASRFGATFWLCGPIGSTSSSVDRRSFAFAIATSTRLPLRAAASPSDAATVVLPTPPFPTTNRNC